MTSESRNRPPFSNGTEGDVWMAAWCERCLVDAPFRNGINPTGCELILTAMLGGTPAEWLDGPRDEHGRYSMEHKYTCINFRAPRDGGGEPKTKPTPRGQGELFSREGHEGPRVLSPLPDDIPAAVEVAAW